MPKVSRTALIPFSAEQLYQLVLDVNAYPEFLPWCKEAKEISRTNVQQVASLLLSKGAIRQSFTTKNQLTENQVIRMTLVDGPFKRLDGGWTFESLGDLGCKVSFNIEFEFSSRLLSLTVGPVFDRICGTLVDAFVARAKQVYGKK